MTTETTSDFDSVASEGLPGGVRTAAECHAEFQSAVEAYEKARERWESLADRLRTVEAHYREIAEDMDRFEALLAAEHEFEAKNAEGRARELTILYSSDDDWCRLRGLKETLTDQRGRYTDEMMTCRDTMSVQKRIMDFEIAYLSSFGGAL